MPPLRSARILDQLRERIRYLHYSLRTEEAYVYRARAFIRFHDFRHPAEMGKAEIEAYLMWLEINESDPLIPRLNPRLIFTVVISVSRQLSR